MAPAAGKLIKPHAQRAKFAIFVIPRKLITLSIGRVEALPQAGLMAVMGWKAVSRLLDAIELIADAITRSVMSLWIEATRLRLSGCHRCSRGSAHPRSLVHQLPHAALRALCD